MNPMLKAALWMIGAIVSFTSMAVAGRELGATLDTFEIMMYRSLVGLLIMVVFLTSTGSWAQIKTQVMGTHAIRNLAHFTGQNLWFYALAVIPLAQVFAMEFTTPLWVFVLAPFLLGEKLTGIKLLAVFIGFVGILIVARPSPSTINAGIVAAATAAIFFATTLTLTKRLTGTETIGCILFWLTAFQSVLGIFAALVDGDALLPTLQTAPFLVLVGIAGLLAHFCITNALAIAPATIVVPFDFLRLPIIAVIGMMLYDEPLEIWVIVGAVVIFGGIYLNVLAENRKNRVA